MAAPCCPPGSHGPLAPDSETLKGWWEKRLELDCYFSGEKDAPKVVILVFADVFGAMSGRHRRICDEMATAIPGSLICLPDLFHGEPICPDYFQHWFPITRLRLSLSYILYRIRYRSGWDVLGPQIEALASSFQAPRCCFGFCFGGYLAAKASSTGLFSAAVGFHPSLLVGKLQCSPHREADADLAQNAKCPIFMLPAQNDDAAATRSGFK